LLEIFYPFQQLIDSGRALLPFLKPGRAFGEHFQSILQALEYFTRDYLIASHLHQARAQDQQVSYQVPAVYRRYVKWFKGQQVWVSYQL